MNNASTGRARTRPDVPIAAVAVLALALALGSPSPLAFAATTVDVTTDMSTPVFTRDGLAEDWLMAQGEWAVEADGIHKRGPGGNGLLLFRQPLAAEAVRIEFEGMSTNPGDLGVYIGCDVRQPGDGRVQIRTREAAYVGFGNRNNTRSAILFDDSVVATNGACITPGTWHRVAAERARGRLSLEVDGRVVLEAPDDPGGVGGPYAGLYVWNESVIRNVRVRAWADPALQEFLSPRARERAAAFPTARFTPESLPDPAAQLTPEAIQRRIEACRMGTALLMLTDAAGAPRTNAAFNVRMTRHRFRFGSNAFSIAPADDSPAQAAYQAQFVRLFNFATVPFYWGGYEKARGQPDADRLLAQVRWLRAHDIEPKGHPLLWRHVTPDWLPDTPATVTALQTDRITRDVTAFRELIGTWDVVNEATDWIDLAPKYDNPLTHAMQADGLVSTIQRAFATAHAANPAATLILNDYQTGPDFAALAEACLHTGAPIHALGIQSHMHTGVWTPAQTWNTVARLQRLRLPLYFSEVTVLSGDTRHPENIDWEHSNTDWPSTPEGEQRQAKQVESFYRLLFSCPTVAAITWWDLSDRHAWMGAPAGLLRQDMSPKPAYHALERLIRGDWWTPMQTVTTDAAGCVRLHGFLGSYAIEGGAGTGTFTIEAPGAPAGDPARVAIDAR